MVNVEDILNTIYARLLANQELVELVSATYQITINDLANEIWYLKATTPTKMSKGAFAANCQIALTSNTLQAITTGSLNPQVAFLKGELTIKGDSYAALKLIKLWSV